MIEPITTKAIATGIGHCTFGNGKANKQLQRLLWSLDFCKISTGSHYTHNKEQHEQGKSDSLHCTVNIHDGIPYRAALKVLWGLGNELPYTNTSPRN